MSSTAVELVRRVDPERVLEDLDALRQATSDRNGAQRVAFSDSWLRARRELIARLPSRDVRSSVDPAGNLWLTHASPADRLVVIGSHVDSVPNGGAFDGVLGVLAGLEILRANLACENPDRRLAVVDFADEEGARFGFSLFGSTGLTGALPDDVGKLHDTEGVTLAAAARGCGIDIAAANSAAERLPNVGAYLELHVEQGQVLEERGQAVAPVTGVTGIARYTMELHGQATHAGAIPMTQRKDPVAALADIVRAVRDDASRADGLATFGRIEAVPNVPTAVPATVHATVDLRHPEADGVAKLVAALDGAVAEAQARHGCQIRTTELWSMPATPFDSGLVGLAARAAAAAGGAADGLLSARGHDAVVLAPHVPTTMLFVPSRRGLSHCPEEHTEDEHVRAGVKALAMLAGDVLDDWG